MKAVYMVLLCWALATNTLAGATTLVAEDEQVEQRLLSIAAELRCLVCQNESIAGSRADLAADLRRQIREQIAAGKSDREIMSYMVDRYGDFVLYRPPLKGSTVLLWFGPGVLLLICLACLVAYLRRRNRRVDESHLSEEERYRAQALLGQKPDNSA